MPKRGFYVSAWKVASQGAPSNAWAVFDARNTGKPREGGVSGMVENVLITIGTSAQEYVYEAEKTKKISFKLEVSIMHETFELSPHY